MQKLKMNDEVVVIAGKEKGKKGKIKKVFPKTSRVIVEGLNMVKKSIKPSQANPAGGISEKEAPIHRSNIALVDEKTGKATRVSIKLVDKKKQRVAIKSSTVLK